MHYVEKLFGMWQKVGILGWYRRSAGGRQDSREVTVNAVAQAMKLHKDAQATFANIKEEAEDICFDAKQQAAEACDCEQ